MFDNEIPQDLGPVGLALKFNFCGINSIFFICNSVHIKIVKVQLVRKKLI